MKIHFSGNTCSVGYTNVHIHECLKEDYVRLKKKYPKYLWTSTISRWPYDQSKWEDHYDKWSPGLYGSFYLEMPEKEYTWFAMANDVQPHPHADKLQRSK